METSAKEAPVTKKLSSNYTVRDFLMSPWIITVVGILIGAWLGFEANRIFYVRGLELRILELNQNVRTLESEKKALEHDLDLTQKENQRLQDRVYELEELLGIKHERPVSSPLKSTGIAISFTAIPVKGQGPESEGWVEGKVEGLPDLGNYKIILYARTDRWYVQPFTEQPFIEINERGQWKSRTHLGQEYAALLVKSNYSPPHAPEQLPSTGNDVLLIATVSAK